MIDGLVSIITPLYNAREFLDDTFNSVIQQTYQNWEWWIVDDCSTDGSFEYISEISKKNEKIHVLRVEKNGGPSKARNIAINSANGQFIAFLDADDLWDNVFLEKQIDLLTKTGAGFAYATCRIHSSKNETVFHVPEKVTYKDILKTNSISCLTVVYDVKICGKEQMPEFGKAEDYICWLQILKRIPYAVGNQECIATYRLVQGSRSSGKLKLIKYMWRIYRKVEHLGFFSSLYYLFCWGINGLKKYRKHKH